MQIKYILFFLVLCLFIFPVNVLAHQPRIVYLQSGEAQIQNPELSQAFYDELKGQPRNYLINSEKDFKLYINLLTPAHANPTGKYSAKVYFKDQEVAFLDGENLKWEQFYEEFGRDYYYKGPEFTKDLPAGNYKITVYAQENLGKYVIAVGKTESYDLRALLNVYWQLPFLKVTFFKTSVLQFFLTPFGIGLVVLIGVLLIIWAVINYIIGVIKTVIKNNQAKTLLLSSGGMEQIKDEILQLLQKPAYDVNVGFINTAYKYKLQEDPNYLNSDLQIMREEIRFNVEEIDIEGKNEQQLLEILRIKDIIFVAGGNAFYLLDAMRKCNFEKIIRKLLKQGIVYIGVSAGSMVAGKSIDVASWKDTSKNIIGLKNLKGLGLVPFDIFVHYQPEYAEMIKQKISNPKKRAKDLRILIDGQAILVQGKEINLIGDGEQIII
jgi:peptidase E